MVLHVGLDVGSTTIKMVVLDENLNIINTSYKRHFSNIKDAVCKVLEQLAFSYNKDEFKIALTGSGAIDIANKLLLPFIQEVVACKRAIEKYIPQTNVVVELGGEDAKIIYFGTAIEQRMNGTCAGGTGAFLDQMASLLHTDASGLNELAKNYHTIYPIASRCGVFAKTDVQPLLNEGAAKEDIAVSILQAVVNQTISGLACGRPIRGNVAFLGGPLNYLSELRKRFAQTLNLTESQVIVPQDAHLFVALGAGCEAMTCKSITVLELKGKVETLKHSSLINTDSLRPLFNTEQEYCDFMQRHTKNKIEKKPIESFAGDCFLGIDAGSTTSKLVLIDADGNLLSSAYNSNEGTPLLSVMNMLKELYAKLPADAKIKFSGVTGYGEKLIQAALNVDVNEIETIAHLVAAQRFEPNVTSIIDIGGQDMKYIKLKNKDIETIMLNEACSSGCGSFLETFAKSLNLSAEQFADEALKSKTPANLGSRCTVFMNSKIKQAQKEGYSVADISAGLSYSVVKNALQKVMKIRDPQKLGKHIVVQGGTFNNNAVLRAFELTIDQNVIRPDIAGLMGAYGMALIACEKYQSVKDEVFESKIANLAQLNSLTIEQTNIRCNRCENCCCLTVNKFGNKNSYISGNRCEKGAGITQRKNTLPNLVKYKYQRIFDYTPLKKEEAKRGVIGIPRVLNMYEDYPFWFTFFTTLGFSVVISEHTNRKTYEKGIESMPSESVCFPAKLAHGHIISLIQKGIKAIFYPCITYSRKEFKDANNNYNCPIVTSYPEVIKNNVEELKLKDVKFINPFLTFEPQKLLQRILELEEFKCYKLTRQEVKQAIAKAEAEYQKCKEDIYTKGQQALKYMQDHNLQGIVLASRPYHVDPEINHGLDNLITSLGFCVLTEDSVAKYAEPARPLRVVDQWQFHSRLYAAADFVGRSSNLELVQINSFGCGIDAITTDQVEEILASFNKMYTLIKIDEVNNLGAARIRLRSLAASINKRLEEQENNQKAAADYRLHRTIFTKDMKKNYTILIPQMAPIHFEFFEPIMQSEGYNVKLLKNCTQKTIEMGLKYVNNDACYPSIIVVGQFLEALTSGEYDPQRTALIITQTGGGCRATNYIGFIRKALKDAGFAQIPVISFNVGGLESNPGFKLSISLVNKLIKGVVLADVLQKMLYKNHAYELYVGQTELLFKSWLKKAKQLVVKGSIKEIGENIERIVADFDQIEFNKALNKPKVGIVGEILIKYHPYGNNFVAELLEKEGAEVILPDLMGFVKFMATDNIVANNLYTNNKKGAILSELALKVLDFFEKATKKALANSKKSYLKPVEIWDLAKEVKPILSVGNQSGEGWFLTAEMLEYIENNITNIVCVQPFACLPNHVVGKGVIKTIRETYPKANIAPIDYDPGASQANQINRIKLLMSVAKDNMKQKET